VTHSAYRLVRPPGNLFDGGNIRVHGIRPHDVEHEPEFPRIWRELSDCMNGKTLIAHNAAFDVSVLRATLSYYGLPLPELPTVCTLAVARRAWPGLPRYGLPHVAAHLGMQFRHHHALEDAEVSAGIALRAAAALGIADVGELHDALLDPRPWPMAATCASILASGPQRRPTPRDDADPAHPLFGRTMVVTGVFQSMSRDEALEAIAAVGGRSVAQVSAQVDYLVTGEDPGWAKLERARELRAAGHDLQVIDERRFLTLLGWSQA
jgi:DNA polymerase-3 subunit epsilon